MSFDTLSATPLGEVTRGAQMTFAYPTGRTQDSYESTGATLLVNGEAYAQSSEVFSVSYEASSVRLVWGAGPNVPAAGTWALRAPLTRSAGVIAGPVLKAVASSAVAVSLTGSTSETVLATIPIQAGILGANGSLRISTFWSFTSSANNKTPRIRLGGVSGTAFSLINMTTATTGRVDALITNRNSEASQIGFGSANRGNDQLMTVIAPVTGTINTANAVDLVLTAQLALGSETVTLESYLIEILRG